MVDTARHLWLDNDTSNTATAPKTPGYNCQLNIILSTDKNGRKIAHYWARGRQFRCSAINAELWIAQGLATRIAG